MSTILGPAPVPEKVRWGRWAESGRVGMITESEEGIGFILWQFLQLELMAKFLNQLGRVLGSWPLFLLLEEAEGAEKYQIIITDSMARRLGSVWIGTLPGSSEEWRGFVGAGTLPGATVTKVWQVYQRWSDGSYRCIGAYDTLEDRIAS